MTINAHSRNAWLSPQATGTRGKVVDLVAGRPRAAAEPLRFDDTMPLTRAVRPCEPDGVSGDWDVLCAALEARLGALAGEPRMQAAPSAGGTVPGAVWRGVLECVTALAQLRSALTKERARGREVDAALLAAQSHLVQMRAELAGTRAGARQAWHRAQHDGLTSLPNRSCFRERLDHALLSASSRDQSLAVFYIDLDGFKPINDNHGHAVGDEMLRIVSARLVGALRADDLVSRQGGDEFACLVSLVPPCEARLNGLARKLFEAVSAPFRLGALQLSVRPSIGIAVWPDDGACAEALLHHADAAMYRAKRERCGHTFFDARVMTGNPPAEQAFADHRDAATVPTATTTA